MPDGLATSDSPLLFERDGAVARLTLNRPGAANAIDVPLSRALMLAAIRCDEDDSIRAVLLTGSGRFFCTGGDIRAFAAAGAAGVASFVKEGTAYLHMAVARLARMNKPLVVSVNGPSAGAGFSLCLIGDIVIAARTAQFVAAYTALGVSPDGGLTRVLPRLVGLRRAQELMLTNRTLSADEACQLGLVTRVCDDASLSNEAQRQALELATGPTTAYGATRRMLLRSSESSLESALEEESRALAEMARGLHGQEGISAFISKRKPVFS